MICDICKYKMNKIHINLPFFRHFDFLKTANFKNLYKCEKCSLVVSSKVSSKEMNIMKSKKYMNKAQVKKEVSKEVDSFRNRSKEALIHHQELSLNIKNKYFEPVTKKSVQRFLEFN